VTDRTPKHWSTVCELTDAVMEALTDVEQALVSVDGDSLDPLEFRALLWAKCSLATLYGMRAEEATSDMSELVEMLDGDWMISLLVD
jgi:hypothetical protein